VPILVYDYNRIFGLKGKRMSDPLEALKGVVEETRLRILQAISKKVLPEPLTLLKALAEETRLRILRAISRRELCVSELVQVLGAPQSSISRHLAALKQDGLAADRREGTWVYYSISAGENPLVKALWEALSPYLDERFFPQDLERLDVVLRSREARTKNYFDTVAKEWDRIKRDYIDECPAFHVVAMLVGRDAVVADVGSGTGEFLVALARRVGRVIGVDNSEKMLAAAGERIEHYGLTNVSLRLGEAEALPIGDGECDAAYSSMLLHHLSEPALGIRELARVVKPGGKVVISDLVQHEFDWAREVMADVWLGFTEEQVREWLTQAGLHDITYSSAAFGPPLEEESPTRLNAFVATATKP
jgi:ubiquinone/menaquinone biosynthesis C-methylase UbiE/DNA-binding transcriptional ArsR family regulator